MEELLNKLIEKGWKPFGRETRHELSSGVVYDTIDFKGKGDIRVIDRRHHHIRELVAKESGLWQFVCENGMVDKKSERYYKCFITPYEDANDYEVLSDLEYRIIESALKDESELEDFLLQNIKVGNED